MIETTNMDQQNKCDLECNSQTLSSTNNIRNEKSESGVESISSHKGNAIDHQNMDYAESDTQDATQDGDLDPRIQIELEKLNSSTDVINKLELDLEEARSTFRHLLGESGRQLNQLYKELGTSVEKARCYYDARMKARAALSEAQRAAARFEKASSAHDAAKEMVTLAEEGFMERGIVHFDQAWQEMLNHATKRVNESEVERNLSSEEHKVKSRSYQIAEQKVIVLQRSLKRPINKSRPYFEAKARLNQSLDDQKRQIQLIEETIQMTKVGYADSLKQLEKISEEIHERRRKESSLNALQDQSVSQSKENIDTLGSRQEGVGAEFPSPCLNDKLLKQISKRQKESFKENKMKQKKYNTHERKVQHRSNVSSSLAQSDQSNDQSTDIDETPNNSESKKNDGNNIDRLPLVDSKSITSKKYTSRKNRKPRKKRYEKLPEHASNANHVKCLNKSSAKNNMNSVKSETDTDAAPRNAESGESPNIRASPSSSSNTESALNEGDSKLSSYISEEDSSSSSSISSESDSTKAQFKLSYKPLSSLKVSNEEKIVCSSNSTENNPSTSKLGDPIHPFDNNVTFNCIDLTNISHLGDGASNLPQSTTKKNIYSPTGLTNKYLSIKQEESEFSDAESLASLDPLDDTQIEQLMKDATLQRAAEDILNAQATDTNLLSENECKNNA